MAFLQTDQSRLNGQLNDMRQKCEEALAAQPIEANKLLEERLKHLREELLNSEQRLIEAQHVVAITTLHRQSAENECSRLIKFIEVSLF